MKLGSLLVLSLAAVATATVDNSTDDLEATITATMNQLQAVSSNASGTTNPKTPTKKAMSNSDGVSQGCARGCSGHGTCSNGACVCEMCPRLLWPRNLLQ